MPTETEEQQAREFLKRAEIKTMKKDLQALREFDALKERDKISKLKTIEEQKRELQMTIEAREAEVAKQQKGKREEVLQRNAGQEHMAEQDLKKYATEEERQQIFLIESSRLNFEKRVEAIDKEKDPALKLQKNKLLLEQRDWQTKLNAVIEQERKLEGEEKLIVEKQQASAIPSEKRGLEQRKSELDKEIQNTEKKRWELEKQIGAMEAKIQEINKMSEQLVVEKNDMRTKIMATDKSLREIYSAVIARVEEQRRGESEAQRARAETLAKSKAEEKEKIQRQHWTGKGEKPFLQNTPEALKEKMTKTIDAEEEARKKFMQDIELGTNKGQGQQQQKSKIQ